MNTKQFLGVAAIAVASTTFGQGFFGAGSKDPSEQLRKIFGKNTAFTATAHVTMTNTSKDQSGQPAVMEFQYAMLDGKVRTEMDMTKMQIANVPPAAMAQMKQMGMDRTVHIFLPDKKVAYMLYPSMKAYCEMSSRQTPDQKESKQPKIEETQLGKETIDGHPCLKSKIVVTDEDGSKFESLVWKATDLNDFPIQSQMTKENQIVTTKFTDINRSKPSASLFEPPSDFKRYANMQELMMSNMQRMMPPRGGESE